MDLTTTMIPLSTYLASLRANGKSFDIVWISNPGAGVEEVWLEPWGSQLHLLPHREYAVVAEGIDDDSSWSRITVELRERMTIWPNGSEGNRIYRDDEQLVWDDARPSEASGFINQPGVQAALQWLRRRLE